MEQEHTMHKVWVRDAGTAVLRQVGSQTIFLSPRPHNRSTPAVLLDA